MLEHSGELEFQKQIYGIRCWMLNLMKMQIQKYLPHIQRNTVWQSDKIKIV